MAGNGGGTGEDGAPAAGIQGLSDQDGDEGLAHVGDGHHQSREQARHAERVEGACVAAATAADVHAAPDPGHEQPERHGPQQVPEDDRGEQG